MTSTAAHPEAYVAELPEDRREAINRLRKEIIKHLPEGFQEGMQYGMIGYYVPHGRYPAGYHCDPKQPLPFMSIASQKNFIAIYHMGLYIDQALMDWFTAAYATSGKTKLDMGKSCIRFKKPEQIPFELIGELAGKMSAEEWIRMYEEKLNH